MLYFIGYAISGFIIIMGGGFTLSKLHEKSKFKPGTPKAVVIPSMKSRAVITFSMILPFAALSFLLLCFNPMNIAQSLHQEGHYAFVVEALILPTVSFLIGYFYFRRLVRY